MGNFHQVQHGLELLQSMNCLLRAVATLFTSRTKRTHKESVVAICVGGVGDVLIVELHCHHRWLISSCRGDGHS